MAVLIHLFRCTVWAAAVAVLCIAGTRRAAPAQPSSAGEYEVKAAFLYSFARFVEWPAEALNGDSIVIGVLGSDPFGMVLDRLAAQQQSVHGKKLSVLRLNSTEQVKHCHILYISRSEETRLHSVLSDLEGSAVLTVSDIDRFLDRGGTIHLLVIDNKVRFEINLVPAERGGLKISSQLLKLATRVRGLP